MSIPNGVFYYNKAKLITGENQIQKGEIMLLYRRIRDLREDSDKTQTDIAAVLNMQVTVYQRYERGEREVPLWVAIKLADYYGVSLDYLAGRRNDGYPSGK